MAEKVKKLRADRKAQRAHDAEVQAERDRPTVDRIAAYWKRFGEARRAADISVKSWFKAMEMYYGNGDGKVDKEYEQKEVGKKIKRDTTLPYGYNFYHGDANRLCKAADRLNCSVDYLLCRTDVPQMATQGTTAAVPPAEGWVPLQYLPGKEPAQEGQLAVAKFAAPGMDKPMRTIVCWTGGRWCFPHGAAIDAECVGWYPLPKEDDDETA